MMPGKVDTNTMQFNILYAIACQGALWDTRHWRGMGFEAQ